MGEEVRNKKIKWEDSEQRGKKGMHQQDEKSDEGNNLEGEREMMLIPNW